MSSISLEASLVEKYEAVIKNAEAEILDAQRNLARIAFIYGGQLSLESLRSDVSNTTDGT